MTISDPERGLVRCLGLAAAAIIAFAASSQQRAEALSVASPGTASSAKHATDGTTIQVRGGHGHGGGGGFRGGGGFHGGARRFMAAGLEAAVSPSTAEPFELHPSFAAAACVTAASATVAIA